MAGNRYRIGDIANLYSRAQWEKIKPLGSDDTDKYDLFVSNQHKNRLTKKVLSDHTIEIPDLDHQFVYADSFYFVEFLSKKKEDRYNQLRVSVFTEVMDALSLEQMMASFFNDLDIHVYGPWKELIDKFDRNDKQYINVLFGELISQDNEVMNGVRKLRIAVKNITELYKKV